MLTISAKDFGPIIEGTVELKPLTVFVGPSNTGKSYFATLIYALMQSNPGILAYGRYVLPEEARFRRLRRAGLVPGTEPEISAEVKEAINRWIQDVELGDRGFSETRLDFDGIPPVVQKLANEAVKSSLQSTVELFNSELQRCHGEVAGLRRRSDAASPMRIGIDQSRPLLRLSLGEEPERNQMGLLKEDFDLSESKIRLDPYLKRQLQRMPSTFTRTNRSLEPAVESFIYYDFLSTLVQDTRSHLFGNFPENSYYLPAARSGIAQGHKAIASILVRQSPFAGLRPFEIPTLSGIVTDFMSHILTMERGGGRNTESPLGKEVNFLEHEVVKGRVDIDAGRQLTYPEIYYAPFDGQPVTGNFPLHKTSSMVSELAPVILFLKYLVRPGDLLILEEPESHLHPASQRQMARAIARLVNAGVKVIITTHSDYFVGQLNNLLRISHASKRWLKRENFESTDCLRHADVSAYAFHWNEEEDGSRVEKLTIRPDIGIDEEEFGKVSIDLYEETLLVQRIRPKPVPNRQ